MTQGPMGLFDGLNSLFGISSGQLTGQMSIPDIGYQQQQAMSQQQAQNVGWYQQQAMNAYQPCIPIDDYMKAMIELDALYPNANVDWPKYVEPLLLRFLRWIVSKL